MAVLTFSGSQVAYFGGIDSNGGSTTFTNINNPFLASDLVEIEIPDQYINANGEFNPNEVQFIRVTVIRDGVLYDFGVNAGSKIKESGGGSAPEQGDTFFITNDAVNPPGSGPFSGLSSGKLVFATDDTFTTGQNTAIVRSTVQDNNYDGDTADSGESANGNFNATRPASPPPCYATGTMIETPTGPRAIETLCAGDMVATLDHGACIVRWVQSGIQALDRVADEGKPVMIKAGSFGRDNPARDLIVSPQHRILVGGRGQLEALSANEAFAPAKSLAGMPGIRFMRGRSDITWHHFALDRHELVIANGCTTESLLLGPMVLRNLTPDERRALLRVFADQGKTGCLNGAPARPCLSVTQVRRLAGKANARPIAA